MIISGVARLQIIGGLEERIGVQTPPFLESYKCYDVSIGILYWYDTRGYSHLFFICRLSVQSEIWYNS